MRVVLTPHPDLPSPAIAIEGEAERLAGGRLSLRYRLTGDLAALRIPPPANAGRTDGLWRHICFEAFVAGGGAAYREFNFAPSGQWAAYRFDGYREGMAAADTEPSSRVTRSETGLVLEAEAGLGDLPGPWRVGLTAVIEAADGSLSYWALAHPAAKPDFHNADCFTLELAAPEGA